MLNMNTLSNVLSGTFPTATLHGGNHAIPCQNPPARTNPQNAPMMATAIQDGIFDNFESHSKTESGILLLTKQDDSFIIKPNFGILLPEQNSGILLA